MKEVKINFDEDLYARIQKVRKKESPQQRNKTFCRDLIKAMVGALEDEHKKQEKKNVRKRPKKRKNSR